MIRTGELAPAALLIPHQLHAAMRADVVERADLVVLAADDHDRGGRSEEHTSELQSLMRISYAVFCLKKKKLDQHITEQLRIPKHCNMQRTGHRNFDVNDK